MIGRSGERGSGISVLAARHDDDEYKLSKKGGKIMNLHIRKQYLSTDRLCLYKQEMEK